MVCLALSPLIAFFVLITICEELTKAQKRRAKEKIRTDCDAAWKKQGEEAGQRLEAMGFIKRDDGGWVIPPEDAGKLIQDTLEEFRKRTKAAVEVRKALWHAIINDPNNPPRRTLDGDLWEGSVESRLEEEKPDDKIQ